MTQGSRGVKSVIFLIIFSFITLPLKFTVYGVVTGGKICCTRATLHPPWKSPIFTPIQPFAILVRFSMPPRDKRSVLKHTLSLVHLRFTVYFDSQFNISSARTVDGSFMYRSAAQSLTRVFITRRHRFERIQDLFFALK